MQLIPNQPINFGTYFETKICPPCDDDKEYCALYNHGDHLTAQWKADACSEELLCNIEFATSLSAELLTDGDFTTCPGAWTITGGSWSCGAGIVTSNAGVGGDLFQNGVGIIAGRTYRVTFTVSGRTDGTVTAVVAGAGGLTIDADGTYTQDIQAFDGSGQFLFSRDAGSLFDGSIDDVSLKEIESNCWFLEDGGWSFANGMACHSDGYTGALFNNNVSIIYGTYYRAIITVSGLTTGSINIYIGGTTQTISSNGTFTYFITAGTTDNAYKIVPTSDFDGCISAPSLVKYPAITDYELGLFDKDGNYVQNISTDNLSFSNDFVSLEWEVPELDGCFKICLKENCTEPLGWDDWLLDAPFGTIDITLHATFISDGVGGAPSMEHDYDFTPDCEYLIKLTFGTVDAGFIGTDVQIVFGNASTLITVDANTDHHIIGVRLTPTSNAFSKIKIFFDNSVAAGQAMEILEITIRTSAECNLEENAFCSNCINIKESHECTMTFIATCLEPSLGFNFTSFQLRQRLKCSFMNPIGTGVNNNYKLSNGSYYKNFAERDKVFDLVFLPVDENTHDAINVILLCDLLFINATFYTWLESDYKPEWDKKGALKLVESRIQIRRTDNHLTNSNCS